MKNRKPTLEDKHTLARRKALSHRRADVANRLRILRSRGIKVRTIWSGACWVVLHGTKGAYRHASTINARIDGVFVDDSPSKGATEAAEIDGTTFYWREA